MRDGTKSLEGFSDRSPRRDADPDHRAQPGWLPRVGSRPLRSRLEGSAFGISIYTIAAPSPGNDDFASYYNALFTDQSGDSTAFRFFNSLDVVPNAWASLATVETYYPPLVTVPRHQQNHWPRGKAVAGNTVSLGSLRSVAQSNYPALSSRRLVRTEAAWSSILSRMRCFCGRPPNNMPARRIRRCCRRL